MNTLLNPAFDPTRMPRIWTLMTEDERVRMYRSAADERVEKDVLEAVQEDIRQRLEMRNRWGS